MAHAFAGAHVRRPAIIRKDIFERGFNTGVIVLDSIVSTVIELLYVVSTLVFAAAGLTVVGMAVRAYAQTSRQAMLHLSLGFSLAVAGATATMISAFITDFTGTRSLLLVNSGLTTFGFLFVTYSLFVYE